MGSLYEKALEILDEHYGLDEVESIMPFPLKLVIGCAQIDSEISANNNVFLTYKYNDYDLDFDVEKDYTFSIYIGNKLAVNGQCPYGHTAEIRYIINETVDVYKSDIAEVENKNQEKIYDLERKGAFFFLCLYFAVYNNKELFLHYLKKAAMKNPFFMKYLIREYKCGDKQQRLIGRKLNYNLCKRK